LRRCLALLLLVAAGAARAERLPPTWYETSLLVAAEASLAADMLQTLDIKRHPTYGPEYSGPTVWPEPYNLHEINPVLGPHPSDATIVAYFAGSGLLTAGAWYVLPARWRFIVPVAVLAVEVPMIGHNMHIGLKMRL
jgi:hypothetical protein